MRKCNEIQVIVEHLQKRRDIHLDKADTYVKISCQAKIEMDKILKAMETLESGSEEMRTKLNQPLIRKGNKMISVLQCLRDEIEEISPYTTFGQH